MDMVAVPTPSPAPSKSTWRCSSQLRSLVVQAVSLHRQAGIAGYDDRIGGIGRDVRSLRLPGKFSSV